ncbi:MAG: hypothetical protein R3F65_03395 [bacterium]
MRHAFLLLASLLAATACTSHETYVKTDSALGRVVVYRNGIAYYERRARPTGEQLLLTVPQDKVDDFLKSLTVTDARTGHTIPVSYPTRGASEGDQVQMTLQLPPGTGEELVITYITDAPAWKPSYRVVVGDEGKVAVQSWAIVDNTTGEDWNHVRVGVGASSALSFRYDLRSVVNVHRETLGGQQAFAIAPPMGGATHGAKTPEEQQVALVLPQELLAQARQDPTTDEILEESADKVVATHAGAVATRAARADRPAAARADADLFTPAPPAQAAQAAAQAAAVDARLQGIASRVKASRETIVVQGYRQAHQGDDIALEQAHHVRNRLIEMGVAPGRVQVQSKGFVPGKSGVDMHLVAAAAPDGAPADPVGESHFESQAPMSIPRGTSAMVAVLDGATDGEIVYLYNPDAERGDARFAFKSVRFKNPTESTLETGPVTVYGARRFIGEGITDAIPPRSTAIVPYALDRMVAVSRDNTTREAIKRIVDVRGGVFTAELEHTRRTTFEVENRGHEAVTVFLRHTLGEGWTLGEAPAVYERQGEAHLFAVEVAPGARQSVAIEASTPLTRTLDLRAGAGVELMREHLDSRPGDARFVEAVRTLLGIHDEMVARRDRIDVLRAQLGELRGRSAELTAQIERLDRTTVGLKLRAHLQQKLIDVSDRIQKATVDTVALQEELMLARIRFQDAAAELTLAPAAREVASRASRG